MEKAFIRNFVIIAHVDHGKSTLADRLLELTGTIPKEKLQPQHLDQNPIERERGITIKLAPVRMNYTLDARRYTLNLIDTPGHVDFSYEVGRSLACVEGAVLLVDATAGIQAQTISNAKFAQEENLTLIPVINKIDLAHAEKEKTAEATISTFGFREDELLFISAKTGENVLSLLSTIIARVPPPKGDATKPLQALIFDSHYDSFKGVIAHIRVIDGAIAKGQQILLMGSKAVSNVVEVGVFIPTFLPTDTLSAGEIGYIATGLKDIEKTRVGDTITLRTHPTRFQIPGYKTVKPMVYAAFYPTDSNDFRLLADALAKLKLNDSALQFEPEYSDAIGGGFRLGFLGLLHMEVVQERLEREYGLSLIASQPTVKYEVETLDGKIIIVDRPAKLPNPSLVKQVLEPYIQGHIVTPKDFIGGILELVSERRGEVVHMEYKGNQIILDVLLPLSEIIIDFYNRLKNISSGFATFDYELTGFRPVDAVKLDILVAKEAIDALSQIVVRKNAEYIGRRFVEKLKEVIPRQQFEVSIQAAIGAKIVARADIPAFRKDVTAKLYGGDRTRKDKLLEAQKKGKKRMKMVGSVAIPQEAFLSVFRR